MNSSFSSFDFQLLKHFQPHGNIDPFISIGLKYTDGYTELSSATLDTYNAGHKTSIGWRTGIEWRLTEYTALQTEMRSSQDAFDKFDYDNWVVENLFVEFKALHWFNRKYFGGLTLGSDFDDTGIAMGAFLGIGSF